MRTEEKLRRGVRKKIGKYQLRRWEEKFKNRRRKLEKRGIKKYESRGSNNGKKV